MKKTDIADKLFSTVVEKKNRTVDEFISTVEEKNRTCRHNLLPSVNNIDVLCTSNNFLADLNLSPSVKTNDVLCTLTKVILDLYFSLSVKIYRQAIFSTASSTTES